MHKTYSNMNKLFNLELDSIHKKKSEISESLLKTDWLFLLFGLVIAIAVSSYLIGDKKFYLDEIASITETKNWEIMINVIKNYDGNMWLYDILLHFWIKIGTSEIILRSFSAFFAVLTIIPLYKLTRVLFNSKTARIMMIIFPLNVFFVKNAQFARSYSLLLFLTTCSCYVFVHFLVYQKKAYLILYFVLNVLSIYTHLFGVFIVLSHIFALFFLKNKKNLKIFIFIFFSILMCLLPLVLSKSIHSSQIDWIKKPSLLHQGGIFFILSGDYLPLSIFYAFILLAFLFNRAMYLRRNLTNLSWNYVFITVILLFPIITSFMFSLTIKPIFVLQYLIICLVPFLMIVASILAKIRNQMILKIALILVVVLSIVRLFGWYSQDSKLAIVIQNNYDDWKSVSRYIALNSNPGDAYFVYPVFSQESFDYYFQKEYMEKIIPKIYLGSDSLVTGKPRYFSLMPLLKVNETYKRIWYVLYSGQDVNNKEVNKNITEILSKNYKLREEIEISKSIIRLYENRVLSL